MADQVTQQAVNAANTTAIAVQSHKQPALMEMMASQYSMEPGKFKDVLLKTIFPQDKVATMEQLAMFVIVAHKYKLNPLTKEIYAFPSKGGGIVPVVGIDGWISMVQRQTNYNGHKFLYEWEGGKVGGKLLAVTCQIFRKDLAEPIEQPEFMEECNRETEPWKKWPRRMLTHKAFIQCARYAFGLGGVYDQDEAERILEGELKPMDGGGFRSEIQMPQRKVETTITPNSIQITPDSAVIVSSTAVIPQDAQITETEDSGKPKDYGFGAPPAEGFDQSEDDPDSLPPLTKKDLFAAQQDVPAAPVKDKAKIGDGRAKRIRAIIHSKKTRTDDDLAELLKTFNVEHLADFPMNRHKELEDWAEGKAEGK